MRAMTSLDPNVTPALWREQFFESLLQRYVDLLILHGIFISIELRYCELNCICTMISMGLKYCKEYMRIFCVSLLFGASGGSLLFD